MTRLLFIALCLIGSMTAMAQTPATNRIVVHKGDQTTVGYTISNVDSITFDAIGEVKANINLVETGENSLTLNIEKTADCNTFLLAYEPGNNWDGNGTVADRIKTLNPQTIGSSGQQTLQNLHSGEEYNVYTLALDKYGIEGETDLLQTTVGTGEVDMFNIDVTNITCNNASVKITPVDPEMYYSYETYTQQRYEDIISQYGNINTFDHAWWNFVSEQYGTSWEEAMQSDIVKGTTNIPQSEWLLWDSDYIVTAYGIDYNSGAAITKTTTKQFHTLAPTPSDNQITVEIDTVYRDGVDITVTTTNNDVYLVGAERADYVNYYADNEAMLRAWLSDVHENVSLQHSGNESFKKIVKRADTDYYLIVVGYDGGPTTSLQLIPFHTAAQ